MTRRIASGDYAAGERLPTESELQKEWRVSRSVVREAMKILASQGLVSIQQGGGTFVNEANHDALQNHLEMTLKRAAKNGKPWRSGDAAGAVKAMCAHLDTTGKDLLLARRKGRK